MNNSAIYFQKKYINLLCAYMNLDKQLTQCIMGWVERDSPMGNEAAELGMEDAPPPGEGGAVSAERAWKKNVLFFQVTYDGMNFRYSI